MIYKSTIDCVNDHEKHGHLIRIKEEVDPNLEMAAIQLRVFEQGGKAVLFENIKGCGFMAVSNLFGTLERSEFIFRNTFKKVQQLIELKNDPNQKNASFKEKWVSSKKESLPKYRNLSTSGRTATTIKKADTK